MKKLFQQSLLSISLLFSGIVAMGQDKQYAFRVHFTDKAPTSFTLSDPLAYLSQRAIDRRAKYTIPVDSSDLPVVSIYLDSVLQLTDGRLHTTSRWQNSCVLLLQDSSKISRLQNIAFIDKIKAVAYYSNGLHEKPAVLDSNDTTGQRPTNFDEQFYGAAWQQIHLCNGEYMHLQGRMGEGILIAVIDVGFTGVNTAPAFDSLRKDNRLLDTWNFIYDTTYVFNSGVHGCQVLSCMASYLPQIHVGTAPKASYALYATDDLNTEQAIEEDNFVAATERADSLGADLINTSLGYNTFDNPADSYSYSDLDGNTTLVAKAANIATRKGILMIASAGNEGASTWQHLLTPGDAESALTVGSVSSLKKPAANTGQGPNASGELKPNVAAMGVLAAVISANGGVNQLSGTSFATPILTGLAACLMQRFPDKTPLVIRDLIESVSHLYHNPDNKSGYGVPDFQKAYDPSSSIHNPSEEQTSNFHIYPNPVKNTVFVSYALQGYQKMTLQLYDSYGRELTESILQPGNNSIQKMDVTPLTPGIYILKITTNTWSQIQKIVKE